MLTVGHPLGEIVQNVKECHVNEILGDLAVVPAITPLHTRRGHLPHVRDGADFGDVFLLLSECFAGADGYPASLAHTSHRSELRHLYPP